MKRPDLFLDTSVILAGLVDFGEGSAAPQAVLALVAERRLGTVATAWHCVLEFYSVATRLPPEYRLTPDDAVRLLESEVIARFDVYALPAKRRLEFLRDVAHERAIGGRIYDTHIAEIARSAGAPVVLTENRRHFLGLLRHGTRVLTASEFLEERRETRRS